MAAGSRCVKIEGNGGFMIRARLFKNAVGCVDRCNPKYKAELDALRRLFVRFRSAEGIQKSKDYGTFEKCLRKKYNSAVAFHCSNVLRKMIMNIDWLPGSPEAEAVEECLKTYPGIVHIWATAEDLQALFFPRDGIELPYLYEVEPDGSEMEQTATWSEQPCAASSFRGTSRSSADAIEGGPPFRPVQSLPLRAQADYPSSSSQFPSIAQPQGPIIDIPVDHNRMYNLNCFRRLCGLPFKGGIPEESKMHEIFTLFYLSAKNRELPMSTFVFENEVWHKSKLAVYEAYARQHEVRRLHPEATNFQGWLRANPGKVRLWVAGGDLHAVYVPSQAI